MKAINAKGFVRLWVVRMKIISVILGKINVFKKFLVLITIKPWYWVWDQKSRRTIDFFDLNCYIINMAKRILIIDDDQYLRDLYEEILKESGFEWPKIESNYLLKVINHMREADYI